MTYDRYNSEHPFRILVINPGSNSTKVAVFENDEKVRQFSISHSPENIASFSSRVYDQYEYRLNAILKRMEEEHMELSGFDAVAGRGGFFTVTLCPS